MNLQSNRSMRGSTRARWACAAILVCLALCGTAFGQAKKQKVDLIVAGGTVVSMDAERRVIEDGAVAVSGDTIVAVATRSEILARYAAGRQIDARGKLVLPGFINGHTHVPMTLFRGLRDDVTLDEGLHKYFFPAEAQTVI